MRMRWFIFTLGLLALTILPIKYSYGQRGKEPLRRLLRPHPLWNLLPRRMVLGNNPQGKSTQCFSMGQRLGLVGWPAGGKSGETFFPRQPIIIHGRR